VSGRTAIVGRISPREVAEALDRLVVEGGNTSETDSELTCRGSKAGDEECEDIDGAASEVNGGRELEEKLRVAVDDGMVFGIEAGIATGQNDHTLLPWLYAD
jgi:hypothetical protein